MVEIVKVPGTASGEKTRGWFFDFYNQWPAIFSPQTHNWHDWCLTLFKVMGENSPYKRSWEVEVGLLGFTVIVTYVYRDTCSERVTTKAGGSCDP